MLKGAFFAPFSAAEIADPRDRALANRLVTTALRRHFQIEAILAEVLDKGIPQRSGTLSAILRIGIAQILFMDGMPAHSALHLAVEAARADRRAARFDRLVNGALRTVLRGKDRFAALPAEALFPGTLLEGWRRLYGDGIAQGFGTALLETPPLDLTLKRSPDAETVAALGGARVLGTTIRLMTREAAVADLPFYGEGRWWVQDAAAAIPATLVPAGPGTKILDLCAAPGGKTAQLAATGAEVTALDLDPARVERLRENLGRVGLEAKIVEADALAYAPETEFDAVLLDAPCSATGTFRRHPEVLIHRTPETIAARAELQRRMIGAAARRLKPGGTLVYCACSLEEAEGEAQATWVRGEGLGLAPSAIGAGELEGWEAPVRPDGTLRLHPGLAVPGAAQGTLDGFFIARFTKL